MKEFVVSKNESGQRIDKYVRKFLCDAPLSLIYKTFRKKDVKINGKWVDIDYILQENDVLRIYIKDEIIEQYSAQKSIEHLHFDHEIIYEDDNILVVNKPSGLLVHGDYSEKRITLANQVLSYLYQKGEYDPHSDFGFTPAPAHRIDRNTSGIVIFGKNLPTLQQLLELFKNKENIEKTYLALVVGDVKKDGVINASLLKDEEKGIVKVVNSNVEGAKTAISKYYVQKRFGSYTLLEVQILTGRTHQIRVHMAYANYPLVGDAKYGNFKANKNFKETYHYEGQFLHAKSIAFKNIDGILAYLSGKKFVAKLFKKENSILDALDKK